MLKLVFISTELGITINRMINEKLGIEKFLERFLKRIVLPEAIEKLVSDFAIIDEGYVDEEYGGPYYINVYMPKGSVLESSRDGGAYVNGGPIMQRVAE